MSQLLPVPASWNAEFRAIFSENNDTLPWVHTVPYQVGFAYDRHYYNTDNMERDPTTT